MRIRLIIRHDQKSGIARLARGMAEKDPKEKALFAFTVLIRSDSVV